MGRAARARRREPTASSSPTSSSARRSTARSSAPRASTAAAAAARGDRASCRSPRRTSCRATRTPDEPGRRAPLRRAGRDRPDLLDERHDRDAELHPADGGRPRQLGHRARRGATRPPASRRDSGSSRRTTPARSSPARRSPRSTGSASATSPSARATPSGCCARSSSCGRRPSVLTPSYAALPRRGGGRARTRPRGSSVERVLVAGEPGGGEPAFRTTLEEGWGARVTEAMGIGDIGVSLWGECEEQDGMHLGARGLRPRRADRSARRAARSSSTDGATGELVLTHLRHRAAPLLRFRTRDHVDVRTSAMHVRPHRPAGSLHRADRRHADRPRRQRLPVGHTRGRGRVRAAR